MYKKVNSTSVKFLIIAVLIVISYNNAFSQHNHSNNNPQVGTEQKDTSMTTAIDPVCKMTVMKNDSLSIKYNNADYYFCNDKDMKAFMKEPQKYISGNQEKQEHEHEHGMEHESGMMGMSTTMMIIMGGIMVIGMTAFMVTRK